MGDDVAHLEPGTTDPTVARGAPVVDDERHGSSRGPARQPLPVWLPIAVAVLLLLIGGVLFTRLGPRSGADQLADRPPIDVGPTAGPGSHVLGGPADGAGAADGTPGDSTGTDTTTPDGSRASTSPAGAGPSPTTILGQPPTTAPGSSPTNGPASGPSVSPTVVPGGGSPISPTTAAPVSTTSTGSPPNIVPNPADKSLINVQLIDHAVNISLTNTGDQAGAYQIVAPSDMSGSTTGTLAGHDNRTITLQYTGSVLATKTITGTLAGKPYSITVQFVL